VELILDPSYGRLLLSGLHHITYPLSHLGLCIVLLARVWGAASSKFTTSFTRASISSSLGSCTSSKSITNVWLLNNIESLNIFYFFGGIQGLVECTERWRYFLAILVSTLRTNKHFSLRINPISKISFWPPISLRPSKFPILTLLVHLIYNYRSIKEINIGRLFSDVSFGRVIIYDRPQLLYFHFLFYQLEFSSEPCDFGRFWIFHRNHSNKYGKSSPYYY